MILTALIDDARALWRARALLMVMTKRDVAARHTGTAGGIVWPFLQPLLIVAAYYLVLDQVFAMRLGPEAPVQSVGLYLIVGALPWMAFCDALSRGANSLIEAGGTLQKNPLPPVLYPVRAVLASGAIYGPLLLFIVACYGPQHHFAWALLFIPVLMIAQTFFTVMLAYLLAILTAALRDTAQVLNFFLSIGIYLSPILFPLSLFPEAWSWVLWMNPITAYVIAYQNTILQGNMPDAHIWVSIGIWLTLVAILLNFVTNRSRDQIIDWL